MARFPTIPDRHASRIEKQEQASKISNVFIPMCQIIGDQISLMEFMNSLGRIYRFVRSNYKTVDTLGSVGCIVTILSPLENHKAFRQLLREYECKLTVVCNFPV